MCAAPFESFLPFRGAVWDNAEVATMWVFRLSWKQCWTYMLVAHVTDFYVLEKGMTNEIDKS
jgi:hypothetical protein